MPVRNTVTNDIKIYKKYPNLNFFSYFSKKTQKQVMDIANSRTELNSRACQNFEKEKDGRKSLCSSYPINRFRSDHNQSFWHRKHIFRESQAKFFKFLMLQCPGQEGNNNISFVNCQVRIWKWKIKKKIIIGSVLLFMDFVVGGGQSSPQRLSTGIFWRLIGKIRQGKKVKKQKILWKMRKNGKKKKDEN